MHIELVLRFVIGILFATGAFHATLWLADVQTPTPIQHFFLYVLSSAAFGIAFLVAPYLTTRPFFALRERLYHATAAEVFAAAAGVLLGLLAGALSSFPLSYLPWPLGSLLPVIASGLFVYFGVTTLLLHHREIFGLIGLKQLSERRPTSISEVRPILLDTSAIIDGRVADVSRAGFLRAPVVVPRFVLEELQHIADSSDPMRRTRGRRGLDVLARMQKDSRTLLEISEVEVTNAFGVDSKLIRLARTLACPIMTSDSNLDRVAQLEGIDVLNVNELATALRSAVFPGEEMLVRVVQEGREASQGVGYLDDGTMVVVEDGRAHLGEAIPVVVARVLQTGTGRMIFAQIKSGGNGVRGGEG